MILSLFSGGKISRAPEAKALQPSLCPFLNEALDAARPY
jgi:hypothetical protein